MSRDAYQIVRTLQLSEKGSRLTERENKYLFQVDPSANKAEIKAAVETLFKVTVTRVNTMNVLGKRKRERMRAYGRRASWKRAVVTLKEGDKIDVT